MRRRFSYALTAGVLSSGAPAGLLGVRLAKSHADKMSLQEVGTELRSDRLAYRHRRRNGVHLAMFITAWA
jgi:hypothetical protein